MLTMVFWAKTSTTHDEIVLLKIIHDICYKNTNSTDAKTILDLD